MNGGPQTTDALMMLVCLAPAGSAECLTHMHDFEGTAMKSLDVLLVAAPVVVFVLVRFLWPGRQWRAAGLTLGLVIIPACASVRGISWRIWPRLGAVVERVEYVHRQVVPGNKASASLVWGAVYGLAGYGVDRLVRRPSGGSQVVRSVLVVSKEEVLAKDIGLVRAAVEGKSNELRKLFSDLDSQEHSGGELARRAGRVGEREILGGLLLDHPRELRSGTADRVRPCLLYTSDAADDLLCVDLGGRRIIKKKQSPHPGSGLYTC